MKHVFFLIISINLFTTGSAQFVARMEVKEPIPGVCDNNNVIAILPTMKGQQAAVCPVSNEEILKRLHAEVQFIKDNPTFEGKGMMGLVINCTGKVVQCKMDNKTGNEELDKQIEAVFNTLGEWKPGKLNKKEVDTSKLFSFSIQNGAFSF